MNKFTPILFLSLLVIIAGCEPDGGVSTDENNLNCTSLETDESSDVACGCSSPPEGWKEEQTAGCYYKLHKNTVRRLVSSRCDDSDEVKHLYYETPVDAYANYHKDTKDLITYPNSNARPF